MREDGDRNGTGGQLRTTKENSVTVLPTVTLSARSSGIQTLPGEWERGLRKERTQVLGALNLSLLCSCTIMNRAAYGGQRKSVFGPWDTKGCRGETNIGPGECCMQGLCHHSHKALSPKPESTLVLTVLSCCQSCWVSLEDWVCALLQEAVLERIPLSLFSFYRFWWTETQGETPTLLCDLLPSGVETAQIHCSTPTPRCDLKVQILKEPDETLLPFPFQILKLSH